MLKPKLHPGNFVIISTLSIIAIFVINSWTGYMFILGIGLVNLGLLAQRLKLKNLLWFSLSLLPAMLAIFLSSYWFSDRSWLGLSKHQRVMHSLTLSSLRLFDLGLISYAFMLHLPKDTLITELMQRKILPVKIGYSLLAVFNAFTYLAGEFRRIQLAYMLRYQRSALNIKIFIPLLVAAARYAHALSISMYTRGLNQNRSYFQPVQKLTFQDYVYISSNCLIYMAIIFLCRH